jgi:TnpA family transposase
MNTMLSRFSRKYFGKGQGIVADTLITDNYLPASSKLIAANYREAIYTLDLIKRNMVVNTQIHSTDTHGVTSAVYAISPFYYVQMAPRDVTISQQPRAIFRQDGHLIKNYQDKKTCCHQLTT